MTADAISFYLDDDDDYDEEDYYCDCGAISYACDCPDAPHNYYEEDDE